MFITIRLLSSASFTLPKSTSQNSCSIKPAAVTVTCSPKSRCDGGLINKLITHSNYCLQFLFGAKWARGVSSKRKCISIGTRFERITLHLGSGFYPYSKMNVLFIASVKLEKGSTDIDDFFDPVGGAGFVCQGTWVNPGWTVRLKMNVNHILLLLSANLIRVLFKITYHRKIVQ